MSAQEVELEITILSIIAASAKPGGIPIVAPNYGTARDRILHRLGKCDQFARGRRVMRAMQDKGLLVRLQDNVWGFSSEDVARKRYIELLHIVAHPSADKLNPSLRETLSGLMAPSAVATA